MRKNGTTMTPLFQKSGELKISFIIIKLLLKFSEGWIAIRNFYEFNKMKVFQIIFFLSFIIDRKIWLTSLT